MVHVIVNVRHNPIGTGTFVVEMFVDVILPLALPGLLTYAVPEEVGTRVKVGCRVIVPLRGKRLHTAVVREVHERKPAHATLPFVSLLDTTPLLSLETLKFWDWMSSHYCLSLIHI